MLARRWNPRAWELAASAWLDNNTWESEDGPTKIEFCFSGVLGRADTWCDNYHVAIEDTGDDDTPACTRVFDFTKPTPVAQAAPAKPPKSPSCTALEARLSATAPP